MPEIFSPNLFTEETKSKMREAESRGYRSSNTKAQILKEDDNYIGEGGRVVVAAEEVDPAKLVAISMKETSPKEAKTVYYNQKLLKTMFPYNFPNIYAAWGKQEGKGVSTNFRERIYGRKFTKEEANDVHENKLVLSKNNPFYKVIATFKGLDIPIVFDKNERNYMISDYEDEMFVDTINYNKWTLDQKDRVLEFMHTNGFNERDIKTAEVCLSRLIAVNGKE